MQLQVQRELHQKRQSHFKNFVHELTGDPDFHPRLKQAAMDAAILYAGPKVFRKFNTPEVQRALRVGALRVFKPSKIARARRIGALRAEKIAKGLNIAGRKAYGSVKIIRQPIQAIRKKKVIIPTK